MATFGEQFKKKWDNTPPAARAVTAIVLVLGTLMIGASVVMGPAKAQPQKRTVAASETNLLLPKGKDKTVEKVAAESASNGQEIDKVKAELAKEKADNQAMLQRLEASEKSRTTSSVDAEVVQELIALKKRLDEVEKNKSAGPGPKLNDPVVSLTLVPKNLPSQTIILQLDEPLAAVGAKPEEEAPSDNVYTDRIRYVMRQIALGKTPEGFAEGGLPRAVARMDQLMVIPEVRYSGSSYDVYRYRVENVSDVTVEMDEQAFASDGVRAVAIFPNAILDKGQSTSVFVMADKAAMGGR